MARWTREALTFASFIIHSAPWALLLILSDFDLAIVDFVIPTPRQSPSFSFESFNISWIMIQRFVFNE